MILREKEKNIYPHYIQIDQHIMKKELIAGKEITQHWQEPFRY